MPEYNWLDRLHQEHPEAKIMAEWLRELLDGRDVKTLSETEFQAARALTNTIFEIGVKYGKGIPE